MKHKMERFLLSGVLCLLASAASAEQWEEAMSDTLRTHFLMEAGLHAGGDPLIKAPYTNGDIATIDAGEGLALSLGVLFDKPYVQTRLKLGWRYTGILANNGDIDWTRLPIDAVVLYKLDRWRFGGGLTYHLNPRLKGSGAADYIDVDFASTLGALAEIDYFVSRKVYLGGVFTLIKYDAKEYAITTNANSLGIQAGVVF